MRLKTDRSGRRLVSPTLTTFVALLYALPTRAADDVIQLSHAGRERLALVHVPAAVREAKAPAAVVIAYHGGGGSAEQFRADAGLDSLADREGFIALYPEGVARPGRLTARFHTWNAGRCCGYAQKQGVDDVAFSTALLTELATRESIDRSRVFALGHSNGAMMSYRLAAEAGEHVAAIAPVGGAMNVSHFEPKRPVAVLHIHSVDDPRALYEGGLGPPFPFTRQRSHHEPVAAGLAAWREQNGCTGEGTVSEKRKGPEGRIDEGHVAERVDYSPCTTERPVVLWRLHGAGHGWPGAASLEKKRPRWWSRQIGPDTAVVDAVEEAWKFFAAVPARDDR